jgi:hypothetical protein
MTPRRGPCGEAIIVMGFYIGRRKGKGLGHVIVGTFPLWGGPYLLWLASLTDGDVLDRLERLEGG